MLSKWYAVPAVLLSSLAIAGCGGDDASVDICEGKELIPHLSPVSLGEFSASQTPFQWNLVLHSPCDEAVTISEACLVGDNVGEFVMEGPDRMVASRDRNSVVRLTYERSSAAEQDDIALVVQSDADNAPTLVVPICARVVDGSPSDESLECDSPVAIPSEGEQVDGLCS